MKFLSFLTLLIVMLGLGCSTNQLYSYKPKIPKPPTNLQFVQQIPIYLDKTFTENERQVLLTCIDEWNKALNGQVIMFLENDRFDRDSLDWRKTIKKINKTGQGHVILGLNDEDELIEDVIEENDGTLAFVNREGDIGFMLIILRNRIGSRNLHTIMMHELGHMLGAKHVNANSLMFPHYGHMQYDCIDKITMLQVANYKKIDFKLTNYCSTPELP